VRRRRVPRLLEAYHRGVSYARDERAALCTLLDETGPDAPTLCEGWQTRDLAAHLVLRERRPDAAAGVVGGPLAGHTRRVHQTLVGRTPYSRLVHQIRTGPPLLSFFGIPGMDEHVNLVEYFVHHEDVRRAADGWKPREIGPGLTEALWHRLPHSRLLFRRAPVGIELVRDDLPANSGRRRVRIIAKARTPVVTVTGHPAELTLWALGRTSVAQVRLDGSQVDVKRLEETRWRL
jgi:uncharacterized protein (TIGR03085 family)